MIKKGEDLKNYKELEREIFLIRDNNPNPNIWMSDVIDYYQSQVDILFRNAIDNKKAQKINKDILRLIKNLYRETEYELSNEVKLLCELTIK